MIDRLRCAVCEDDDELLIACMQQPAQQWAPTIALSLYKVGDVGVGSALISLVATPR